MLVEIFERTLAHKVLFGPYADQLQGCDAAGKQLIDLRSAFGRNLHPERFAEDDGQRVEIPIGVVLGKRRLRGIEPLLLAPLVPLYVEGEFRAAGSGRRRKALHQVGHIVD